MKTLASFATAFAAALGTVLALALPASAATVQYDFKITSAAQVVVGTGSFSFNDQAGASNLFGETEFVLTAFSLAFGSSNFGLADLDAGNRFAIFGAGKTLLGLEATRGGVSPFSFVPASIGGEDFFVLGTGRSARTFDIDITPAAVVPEPGTLWLTIALLPLATAVRARRRRAAPQRLSASQPA